MGLYDTGAPRPDELCELLAQGEGLRIEKIVSWGAVSPEGFWYDQEEDEWVALLSGTAILRLESRDVGLNAGDTLMLKAHTRHRIEYTSTTPPCIWLCVFGRFDHEADG